MAVIIASLLATSLLIATTSAVSVGSKGCSKNLKTSLRPGGPSRYFNFDSNAAKDKKTNIKRRVRIALPRSYQDDKPAPVILAFHPKHRNGTSFEVMTQFSNNDLNPDAISVYPDGADTVNLFWTGDPYAPHTDKNNDVTFVGELLDQLSDNFCIDRSRVYAAGMDNGGSLVHLLACDPVMSNRIAGFAMTQAPIYTDDAMKQKRACKQTLFDPELCKPSRQVPILQLHGDDNDLSSYFGESFEGATVPIPQVMKQWVEKNGCDLSKGNETTELVGSKVTKYTYDCGPADKPLVTHYVLHGGAHEWPFVESEEGLPSGEAGGFDGTQTITDFFKLHHLPEDIIVDLNTAEANDDKDDTIVDLKDPRKSDEEKAAEVQAAMQKAAEAKVVQDKAEEIKQTEGSLKKADEAAAKIEKESKEKDEL